MRCKGDIILREAIYSHIYLFRLDDQILCLSLVDCITRLQRQPQPSFQTILSTISDNESAVPHSTQARCCFSHTSASNLASRSIATLQVRPAALQCCRTRVASVHLSLVSLPLALLIYLVFCLCSSSLLTDTLSMQGRRCRGRTSQYETS